MVSRRRFLKTIGGAVTVAAAPLFAKGCASGVGVYRGTLDGNIIAIPKTEMGSLKQPNGVLLVHTKNFPVTIVLRNIEGRGLIALSTICAHLGCEVHVMPNSFQCPCHGSEYNVAGEVTQGPARKSLQQFKIEETSETIMINIEEK